MMTDRDVLAIDGGSPVIDRTLAPWPHVEAEDIERVAGVLRSGRLNYWTGTRGRALEDVMTARFGRRAIAMANGSVTLETALNVLGIGPGDEVIVPARTFVATASTVVMAGAKPIICDIEPDSGNVSVETAARVLSPRTKAIVPVHVGGWPVEMGPLVQWADEVGVSVIEDCAQAMGSMLDGQPVGSFGKFGSFSFCQDKIITTGGEGGALLAADDELWELAWRHKDHGKDPALMFGPPTGDGALFKFVHTSFGTNLRMTEMQAELGICGLERLDAYLAARRANAQTLIDAFESISALRVPLPRAGIEHAYYRLTVLVDEELLAPGWSRDRLIRALRAEGAPCSQGVCSEIHREAAFERAGIEMTDPLTAASEYGRVSMAFLVHPTLTIDDMHDIARAVHRVFAQAAVR